MNQKKIKELSKSAIYFIIATFAGAVLAIALKYSLTMVDLINGRIFSLIYVELHNYQELINGLGFWIIQVVTHMFRAYVKWLIDTRNIREAVNSLQKTGGSIPSEVIERVGELFSKDKDRARQIMDLVYFLEKRVEKGRLYSDSLQSIVSMLEDIDIPRYAQHIFSDEIHGISREMNDLSTGRVIKGYSLYKQFQIAASIASYYSSKDPVRLSTVYATSLDLPSEFISTFGYDYFRIQETLPNVGIEIFEKYAAIERNNLAALLQDDKGETNRFFPNKARIVIIRKEKLLEDYYKIKQDGLDRSGFVKFNEWHLKNRFGLKYLILEDAYPKDGRKDPLLSYADELRQRTDSSVSEDDIDDFIVYNEEVVFGRVNPTPYRNGLTEDRNGLVDVRMILSENAVNKGKPYKEFFIRLWRHRTATFSELCQAGYFNADSDLLAAVSARLINLYNELY